MQIKHLTQRLNQQNIQIDLEPKALAWIAKIGFDPVYGARPLKRVIQQQLENPLAQSLLQGQFKSGDIIKITCKKDGLNFMLEK